MNTTPHSSRTNTSRYYIKTFDADGDFVREIPVVATSLSEALVLAAQELTSTEVALERPIVFMPLTSNS